MTKAIAQNTASSGAVYGLGLIGALIYYISTSNSLLEGLFGIIKAILWPAFLIYSLFGHLGM
jgi:hypothetical protein